MAKKAAAPRLLTVPITDLVPDPANARERDDKAREVLAGSTRTFGFGRSLVADGGNVVRAGNGTLEAAKAAGVREVLIIESDGKRPIVVKRPGWSTEEAIAYGVADNYSSDLSRFSGPALQANMTALVEHAVATGSRALVDGVGFSAKDLEGIIERGLVPVPAVQVGAHERAAAGEDRKGNLAERFGVPPFSVMDARQGYWQERKRAWLALGIRSDLGRGAAPGGGGGVYVDFKGGAAPGGSKFPSDRIGPDGKFARGDLHAKVSPGGSPRPAMDYSKHERGDGRGRPIKGGGRKPNAMPGGSMRPLDRMKMGRLTWVPGNRPIEELDDTSRRIAETGGTGTSVFDPVLCELAYRWFCPPGGRVLDPFAGGSVRGIVAAALGRRYVGIDLRVEQLAANREQWTEIGAKLPAPAAPAPLLTADYMPVHTPVERRGAFWFKRDDLFTVAGVRGGKVRTCWGLAQGAKGLVTAGSRASPQVNIVAHIAKRLGIPCRVHTPKGEPSPEVLAAVISGAERIEHPAGYNNVIIARAREDAKTREGWVDIPFGMECQAAVDATRAQVTNIPADVARLVVPVGSGMSLAGILWGLKDQNRALPVLGVVVGADPKKRLDKWAPPGWAGMVELVAAGLDYHAEAKVTSTEGLELDPVYEAKCLPHLRPDDCLWVVGIRQSHTVPEAAANAAPAPAWRKSAPPPVWYEGDSKEAATLMAAEIKRDGPFDFVFSCPPYADLEVYSDDPRDLSTMDYELFLVAYGHIIAEAVALLKPDRFACFVVGDLRGPDGAYRNFVSHTIAAFEKAGARFYNEGILVTAVGSLPVRAGIPFAKSRKLGKTHQNVLVFVKGSAEAAAASIGEAEFGWPALEAIDEAPPAA